MSDIPEKHEILDLGSFRLKVVSIDYLKQLYQRGLDDTAQSNDAISKKKIACPKELPQYFPTKSTISPQSSSIIKIINDLKGDEK